MPAPLSRAIAGQEPIQFTALFFTGKDRTGIPVEMAALRYDVTADTTVQDLPLDHRIPAFRNFIHHVAKVEDNPLSLPYHAQDFIDLLNGYGCLCEGMTIHLAAYLQAYGYKFRMVSLFPGTKAPSGIPYSHSVLEVWLNFQL